MQMHKIEPSDLSQTLANKINSLANLGFSPYYTFKGQPWSRFSNVEKDSQLLKTKIMKQKLLREYV